MFCPICGNDCEEYRFCSRCGTRIADYLIEEMQEEQKIQEDSWQSEPIAEVQLETEGSEKPSFDIPCGVYRCVNSSLALYERECVVSNQVGFFRQYETRIPYDKLTAVIYVREPSGFSRLLFRWEGNKNIPIPNVRQFGNDPTTVTISQRPDTLHISSHPIVRIDNVSDDTLFYHIYYMLKVIAPKTAIFRAEVLMQNIEQVQVLATKTDTSFYYDEYAPHRVQAVEEMCRRTGGAKETVTALVNWLFDKRQEVIYAEDPMAAVQDLNLIIAEKKRREEKAAEESRRVQELNRLLLAMENGAKD